MSEVDRVEDSDMMSLETRHSNSCLELDIEVFRCEWQNRWVEKMVMPGWIMAEQDIKILREDVGWVSGEGRKS